MKKTISPTSRSATAVHQNGGSTRISRVKICLRCLVKSSAQRSESAIRHYGRVAEGVPIAAFGEFCKLIFVKHRDEKNADREDGKPYAFQRRDGETAAELAKRIHKLYDAEKNREPDVFTDRINIDAGILAQCVEHLEGISLDRTELDTKGVAFEEFMGGFFKGDFGQYFTPRELIAFSVEMLDPERKHLVLDPACGSGGFLLYALDHVRREAKRRYPKHNTDAR